MPLAKIDVLVLGGLYEDRQFIIIPGEVNVTTAANATYNHWLECNRGTAVHVFDTYDWEFKSEFDPDNKGSKVPPTISNLVGGNDTGGATNKQPEVGWDDMALGDIFSIRNQLPPEEFPNPPTHQLNKKAIIGGTIGGVCAVVLTVGILIFLTKRCQEPESDKTELDGTSHERCELYHTGAERVEVDGTSHQHFELHAYEPPEIMSQ